MSSTTYQQQQNHLYKQRSTELLQQKRPPLVMKTYQQQPQSSYFPSTNTTNSNKGGGNNSSSSGSSTAPPTTPQIIQTLIHSNTPTKNDDSCDSDSSEEGREPSPPQIQKLGLRVVNPDDEQEDDLMANKVSIVNINNSNTNHHVPSSSPNMVEGKKKGESKPPPAVAVVQLSPPSETEWRVYQQQQQQDKKPDLPPHHQQSLLLLRPVVGDSDISRRESKILAAAGNDYYYSEDIAKSNTQQQQTVMMPSSVPIIHQQQIIAQQQQQIDLPISPVSPTSGGAAVHDNRIITTNYTQSLSSPSPIIEHASSNSPDFSHKSSAPPTNTNSTNKSATFTNTNPSKYAKVSYHLTNDPSALKKYREMAEKTNDPITQLMFAKYLLETANAFRQNPTSAVVGSKWGLGSTTSKSQKPEPHLVVPSLGTTEGSNSSKYSVTSSIASSSNPKTFEGRSSLSNYQQQQSLMNVTIKQQASLNSNSGKKTAHHALSESNEQKRKLLEQEGVKWIIRLAKQNVPEACYMQAHWMDKEMHGFKHNKTKSFALHQIAAKDNIPEAIFAVAEHYYELEQDEKGGIEPARIVRFYQTAANSGYVNAIYKLAFMTIHGKLGIRQSLTEGLKLMYKACTLSSEEFNLPPYTFALMLTNDYDQVDFPQSILEPYGGKEAAILYYERAARLNNDLAQSTLGSIYEHGLYGESMNFARAFDYYEQAAINGNAKAMLGLCRLNNRGSHGPGDKNESVRLENDVSGWLAATPVNEDIAFSWCERSAKAGNVDSLALLGWFYECGFGVPRDFGRAEKYYELAAEKGDLGARSRLLKSNKSITKQQHEVITGGKTNDKMLTKKKKKSHRHQKNSSCKCM